ncbi:MAG: hypothetical protein V1826_00320 [bacterium]
MLRWTRLVLGALDTGVRIVLTVGFLLVALVIVAPPALLILLFLAIRWAGRRLIGRLRAAWSERVGWWHKYADSCKLARTTAAAPRVGDGSFAVYQHLLSGDWCVVIEGCDYKIVSQTLGDFGHTLVQWTSLFTMDCKCIPNGTNLVIDERDYSPFRDYKSPSSAE